MKEVNYYNDFEEISLKLFEPTENEILELIEDAEDKSYAISNYWNKVYNEKLVKSNEAIRNASLMDFWKNVVHIKKLKKAITIPTIFNEKINEIDRRKRNKCLTVLAEQRCLEMIQKLLSAESQKYILLKQQDNNITTGKAELEQFEWLGTQKQLAELFLELERKRWIREKNVKLIKSYFTKSDTIHQTLKPDHDTATGENRYLGIYGTRYKPAFKEIKPNKTK